MIRIQLLLSPEGGRSLKNAQRSTSTSTLPLYDSCSTLVNSTDKPALCCSQNLIVRMQSLWTASLDKNWSAKTLQMVFYFRNEDFLCSAMVPLCYFASFRSSVDRWPVPMLKRDRPSRSLFASSLFWTTQPCEKYLSGRQYLSWPLLVRLSWIRRRLLQRILKSLRLGTRVGMLTLGSRFLPFPGQNIPILPTHSRK